MPIIGERRSHRPGSNGNTNDAMAGFTRAFLNEANSILEEDRLDIFSEPAKVLRRDMSDEALRTFFVEGSADKNGMTAEEYEDHIQMMTEMYENDKEAVLEHSSMGQ